ncbi:unnamed protein product [Adineta steineri]|uniref:Xanthine dehydrogenase n=1 Tax=Adineta steineri TaxID=433720 RepID=A0A819HEN3_9BILA|nr:unnamed protein product [Adineta steineri]CAF3898627.1 unnamed protein product [Adineta steineri]CAF3898764.1 unnamed protein product [Adineta steineri]
MNSISFFVNGKEIIDCNVEPEWTVLWYLRNKLRLTGSKLGCGEGGCGACTILISQCIDRESGEIEHRTINACLAPLCSIDGCHVITVEGLGSVNKSNLHSVQTRLGELSASQCGFCTPGMVMSLYGTLISKDNILPTVHDIEESFDGNLCRCTGYRPILDAAKTFACDIDKIYHEKSSSLSSTTFDKCSSYIQKNSSPINKIEFPSKLLNYIPQSIHIKGSIDWYRPVSLHELLNLRHTYPGNQSKLIFGNTTVQIERKYRNIHSSRLISITHIKELQEIKRTQDSIYFGAGITFTHLKSKLIEWIDDNDHFSKALLHQLKHFASTQIRNVASLGGNIIAASPISDINPILEAAGAILELHRADQTEVRRILLSDFYLGDRRVSMADNEVLVGIHIPLPNSSKNKYFLQSYKQARRRDDSKGIVSGGFQVELEQKNLDNNQWNIVSICFSFGGMASKTIQAKHTQQQLIGLPWTKETINQTYQLLLGEMPLNELSQGGQIEYRRTLVQSFLFKFYSYVCNELRQSINDTSLLDYNRPVSHAQQTIPERPQTQKVVGKPLPHRSTYLHTTGEAVYVDDMPSLVNTLHAALVLSTKPNARIKHIDIEAASKVPGFVAFIDHRDVPGMNKPNGPLPDEEVFVTSIALCIGAIIGVVICETEHAAQIAADLVKIDYELLSPTILSIDDAINHESYFGNETCLQRGDVEKAFADAEHILEETIYIGGQEHFYMETNSCIVIPSHDDNEITIHAGVQSPLAVQQTASLVLNRDVSRIICHVKRIGGAFGGKESRALPHCLAIAVAAVKLNRPVRISLDRYTDIRITGHRHPYKIKYKVGFTKEGRLLGLDIHMWNNAGCTLDASQAVMELGMLHMGNTYQFHNIKIHGRVCKTHTSSNTAFRGFGGPQSILGCETIIEHIAAYLKCDPFSIRTLNLFQEGDITHYGQALENWNVPRILNELKISSDFIQRQINVQEFNQQNIYRKRGISLIPVKFGIGFSVQYYNQAGALVHIYQDGSVVLTHGGVELGQGLHTKMISIAAEVLGCNLDRIRISETSTDKIHNMSPTGGSVSADLNGMAIKHACEQLRQRLDTLIVDNNDNISWEKLIDKAYYARIDLCARGFYITPNMFDADFSQNKATYNYFSQGAAVTEVELDVLTGSWHLLRVDILMDVGTSLNPEIDIGQIEGGFMQGTGLYTMEELIWGDYTNNKWIEPGELFTSGPDTYKIPSFSDTPIDFRVSLLSNSFNPRAVYSSKGIGEPPFVLGISAFFALKQACMAYREQQGLSNYFTFNSPATVERLRMTCADEFTRRACSNDYENFQVKGSF